MTAWKPKGNPLPVDETDGRVEVPFDDEQLDQIADWLAAPLPGIRRAGRFGVEAFHPGHADQSVHGRRHHRKLGLAGGKVPIITAAEARGNSRPVSEQEFHRLAQEGRDRLAMLREHATPPRGLDANWDDVRASAYAEVGKPWGGATFDAHTGRTVQPTTGYALSIKSTASSVTLREGASREEFDAAMDEARKRFGDELSMELGHLGVFHDDDEARIDIDPVVIVGSIHEVETIGAATHAVGGAYGFADGNGYWPPHVAGEVAGEVAAAPPPVNEHPWRGLGEWYRNVRRTQHTEPGR